MGRADAAKILDLRRALAERFPGAVRAGRGARGVVVTGVGCVDGPLGGGLPLGEVVEVVAGGACSGAGLLLVELLRRVLVDRPCVALVDGSDSFDPADLPARLLGKLLWVRCARAGDALRPVDALLRDGNVPLVLMDLRGNAAPELCAIPQHAWFRFQRVAGDAGTALLVAVQRSVVRGVRWRLRLDSRFDLGALQKERAALLGDLCVEVLRGGAGGIAVGAE